MSNTSVLGIKKAVAILFESYGREGLILTEVVKGLPHDSGRAKISGPVLAMRAIEWIEESDSLLGEVVTWFENLEVITGCGREAMSKLLFQACQGNIDLWLNFFALKQKCRTKLLVKYVKAHQDNKAEYETMNFQSKKNVDCDEAAKVVTRRIVEGRGRVQQYHNEMRAML